MFVNGQDTTLLRDALVSAAHHLKSLELSGCKSFDLVDKEGAVEIVSQTILHLSQDTTSVKTGDELLEYQIQLNRRLHAAVFFVFLRSNGITCSEATNYYSSIAHNYPSMNWKYYVKLNFQCNWGEYFIECVQQFQPIIVADISKRLFAIASAYPDDLKNYTVHISLQAVAWSFLTMRTSSLFAPNEHCQFSFPFVDSNLTKETSSDEYEVVKSENPARSQLMHIYVTILNYLFEGLKSGIDSNHAKIILHAYKTVFKLLAIGKDDKEDCTFFICQLNELFENAVDFFLQNDITKEPVSFVLDHSYKNPSWKINTRYLVFLVYNYFYDVLFLCQSKNSSFKTYLPDCSLRSKLQDMCLESKKCFEKEDETYALFLKNMIVYDYPFAHRAAELLLKHPEIISSIGLVDTLEKHSSKLNPVAIFDLIANAAIKADSIKMKIRLLNLYFYILTQGPIEIYNYAVMQTLIQDNSDDHFKLPDFNEKLTQFTRKTMLLEEAQKCLLPLFVQAPYTILKTIMRQVLMRGKDGLYLVQVLKLVPSVCRFGKCSVLSSIISDYFKYGNLNEHEFNHLVYLVKALMEVHTEVEIINFDTFLESCILPYFSTNEKNLYVALECLNVSLPVLLEKRALKIKHEPFILLVNRVASLLNSFVLCGDGKRKEQVLFTLSFFPEIVEILNTKARKTFTFEMCPDYVESIVSVYLMQLLGEEAYKGFVKTLKKIDPTVWVLCCFKKDVSLFKKLLRKKKMKYEELLKLIIPLFTHFTMEEWFLSADLIKEYFNHSSIRSHIRNFPWLLPQSDPKVYAVVRCLTDCYHFIVQEGRCNLSYVTSCFTNTIMGLLSKEAHPQLLLNIFLDLSHLISLGTTETLSALSSFLISLKKDISEKCQDKCVQENFMKLTLLAVKCLPDSDGKNSLLQKF